MNNTTRVILTVLLVATALSALFAITQRNTSSNVQRQLEAARQQGTQAVIVAATSEEARSQDLIAAGTRAALEIDALNDSVIFAEAGATEAADLIVTVQVLADGQATAAAIAQATSTQVSQDIAVIGAAASSGSDQRSQISAAATTVANDLRALAVLATSEVVSAQSTQVALENQIATLEAGGTLDDEETADVQTLDTAVGELERFVTDNVEIYLPADYLASDLTDNLDAFLVVIEGLGGEFAETADAIRANADDFELYAVSNLLNPDLTLDSVNVAREEVLSALMLEDYLVLANRNFDENVTVLNEELIDINGLPAARTFFESEFDGYTSAQIRYVLQAGDVFYTITYTTSSELIESRLPLFEASAATFRVLE